MRLEKQNPERKPRGAGCARRPRAARRLARDPYLTHAAFFQHVPPHVTPDARFGEQAAPRGLFEFFITSVFL